MDRFEITRPGSRGKGRKSPEESRLDGLLSRLDPLLTASLQEEEGHFRRWRRLWRIPVFLLLVLALVFTSSTWISPSRLGPRNYASSQNARAEALLLVQQAHKLKIGGQWEEAFTLLDRATRIAPDRPETWATLAWWYWHRYQIDEAEKTARRSLSLDPSNIGALSVQGEIYASLGETGRAEKLWSKPGLERRLASLYLLEGRFEEAERLLVPLLEQEPANEELQRMTQTARSRSLPYELRARLRIPPHSRSPWTALGWRMHGADRFEEAIPAFERALAEAPGDTAALNGMGHTLLELHRAREARTYFERSLRVAPDNAVALSGLGGSYKAEGRVDEAIETWEKMCRLYPGPHRGKKGLAWIYYERGDYRRAAKYLAELVKRYPNDEKIVQALNISLQKIDAESTPE